MHKGGKELLRRALRAGLVASQRKKHTLISKPSGEPVTILPLGSKESPRLHRSARVHIERAIRELGQEDDL